MAATTVRADPEYWLAHCEGFRVEGDARRLGLVEEVCCDRAGHADLLVLRTGRFGRRRLLVPADEVMSVAPGQERVVVRSPVRILASVLH
jgi:hypothetical protein